MHFQRSFSILIHTRFCFDFLQTSLLLILFVYLITRCQISESGERQACSTEFRGSNSGKEIRFQPYRPALQERNIIFVLRGYIDIEFALYGKVFSGGDRKFSYFSRSFKKYFAGVLFLRWVQLKRVRRK